MCNDEYDAFEEVYSKTKLTLDEMRRFPELKKYSDEELKVIGDDIFDLAVLFKKITL